MRRYTESFLIAAFAAAALIAMRAPAARPDAIVAAHSQAAQVTVVMKEFRFVLSVRSVHVGTVTFRLVNRGRVAHDFKIAGKKSSMIAPGKHGLLRVTFRKAGRYAYLCTVPGHAAAGMKGVLKVTR
jgi:plastocyanin